MISNEYKIMSMMKHMLGQPKLRNNWMIESVMNSWRTSVMVESRLKMDSEND